MKWSHPRFLAALVCALLLALLASLPTTLTTDAAPRPTAIPVAPRPTPTATPDRLVVVADVNDMGEGGYTATIDGRRAMLFPRTTTAPQLLDGDWYLSTLTTHFRIQWRKPS